MKASLKTEAHRACQLLGERGYLVIDHFLSEPETTAIARYAEQLYAGDKMKKAGIGTAHLHRVNENVRGDRIRWIDPHTQPASVQVYMERIKEFSRLLNRNCFLGLKDFELHFACYPPGTFYEKHIDQLQINGARILSCVFYLNNNWTPEQGGQLRIYPEDPELPPVDITPEAGRLALFLSSTVYHEVLPVQQERFSITGWMLNQFKDTTFVSG